MPIGPFSAGILPGGTGFAPVPAPSVPTPAMSGLAVNTNGSLVSMLPPVTDWFSPVTQSPAVQTTAQQTPPTHSCQSGGDCGCGGTCNGKKGNAVSIPASSLAPLQKNLSVSPEIQASYAQGASLMRSGNNTLMSCITTGGEFLSAVARVGNDLSVSLTVTELRSGELRHAATFVPTTSGWSATAANGSTATIPFNSGISLDSLTFAALTSAISLGLTKTKIQVAIEKTNNNKASSSGVLPNAAFGNGSLSTQNTPTSTCPCIEQDLVCSAPGGYDSTWPWTSDHKHIQWWAPCIGSFTTDIESCCFNHDISLWCNKPDPILWEGINAAVEACVMGKVIAQAYATLSQQLSQQSWWLRPFEAAVCYPLVTAWQLALDVALFGIIDQAFAVGETLALLKHPDLYNSDGDHDCSCLCGGTQPTVQCSDVNKYSGYTECTDICALAGDTANEQCYKCGWACQYDASGKPSKVFDDGSDTTKNPNGLSCCPGTAQSCNPPTGAPCPTCAQCGWYCDCKNNVWYESYDVFFPGSDTDVRSLGVPCCNGQDPKNPPPDPHYPCWQFTAAGLPC
jgi:hypothetical protein